MKLIVKENYKKMSEEAAGIFIKAIRNKPDIVIGLATGSTPEEMYKILVKEHKENDLDFSQVTSFNLDEYLGLGEDDETSYRYFMNKNLFDHINIKRENIHIPNGMCKDQESHCQEYDDFIVQCGGIDLLLLGVGEDGHIAFNEPRESLHSKTHVTDLEESTIKVNSKFFPSEDLVPRKAITMGMASILQAKKIVLIANGPKKRKVIARLRESNMIDPKFPVSFLHLHPDVTVIVDREAGESC